MLTRGDGVQCSKLLSSQTHGYHLHRFRASPRPATTASLQLGDVIARLGLVGPLLDLFVGSHANIV